MSVCVQAFPSLDPAPAGSPGIVQAPVVVLETPASWHWSVGVQTTGFDPAQAPDCHMSVCVQAFPSLHPAPSSLPGAVPVSVVVLQTPASWHWSEAAQTTGFDPVQAPDWHMSVCVQAFPSLHEAPFAMTRPAVVPPGDSQPLTAEVTVEAPEAAGVAPVLAGVCCVEVYPFGPGPVYQSA